MTEYRENAVPATHRARLPWLSWFAWWSGLSVSTSALLFVGWASWLLVFRVAVAGPFAGLIVASVVKFFHDAWPWEPR